MKQCRDCGLAKPLTEYHRNKAMPDGRLRVCKPCRKKITAVERHTDQVRALDRQRYRSNPRRRDQAGSWARNHPETARIAGLARHKVHRAVRSGRLTKPDCCESCGEATKLEGAHHDYSQPLAVRWLCRPCHRAWDHADPKGVRIVTCKRCGQQYIEGQPHECIE